MNCEAFESVVIPLIDEKLLDAAARKQAFAHALTCERCAARLTDERVMARGLQALTESTEHAQPRPQLKAALRAAFDEQAASATTTAAAITTVLPFRPRTRLSFGAAAPWTWAAAASVLALFALGLALWLRHDQAPESRLGSLPNTATPAVSPTATPAQPEPKVSASPDTKLLAAHNVTKPVTVKTARKLARPDTTLDRNTTATTAATESSAEFIALSNATQSNSAEDSIVVRVKVPRASLLAMGLPLNTEKADAMISADLKVDLNGTPLAIRLLE